MLSGEFNLFHNTFKDQLSYGPASNVFGVANAAAIVAAGGQANITINFTDKETAMGAEVIINWKIFPAAVLQGSYSYVSVGDDLPQRTPVNMVKLDLSGDPNDKFHYSINYIFESAMNNVGNPDNDTWDDEYDQAGHRFNLAMGYEVSKSANIYLRVHNLFEDDRPTMTFNVNKPYQGLVGSDERRIYLGLRTKF